ncbi:hypothetical protein BDZ97DRAFT_1862956 [Flammula alnicola]|nr:hypothetical protein BDZ97DRAFT_1862956 [Flammula alnicola]
MSRAIMIDDTDPSLVYSGQWIADQGSKDNNGNYGAPYLRTMHYTKGTGSFSYSFHGTYVGVIGATMDSSNPSRDCFIDGVKIESAVLSAAENRVTQCQQYGLSDGPHVITLTVTAPNPSFYWFDFLFYIPSASVSLDNAAIFINTGDPAMQFGTGWAQYAPGYITRQQSSVYSMDFNGESLTWYGFYNSALPFAATTATYSIDGGNPVSFTLNGVASQNTGVELNQIFFSTGQLSNGQHNIKVVYQGNGNTTPLSIYNVIVQTGTGAVASQPASSDGTASSGGTVSSGGTASSGGTPIVPSGSTGGSSGISSASLAGLPALPSNPSNSGVSNSGLNSSTPSSSRSSSSSSSPSLLSGLPAASSAGSSISGQVASDGSSSAASNQNQGHSSNHIGIIAGCIIGVLALALLIFAFLFLRQRNKRLREKAKDSGVDVVEPFNLGPSMAERSSSHSPLSSFNPPFDSKRQQARDVGSSDIYVRTPSSMSPNKPWRLAAGPSEASQTSSSTRPHVSSPSSASASDGPSVIMIHEDSGVRLPQHANLNRSHVNVVEMPPTYSAE